MPDPARFVFVSHVSEDRAAALEIVRELERRDVGCWIAPRDVHPGRPYDDEIAAAIENCQAMLLIFSERCNESEYIRREVTVAGESRKLIIPFRIENVQPKRGLRVRLADLHWIDAFVARAGAVDEVVRTCQLTVGAEPVEPVGPAAAQPRPALNMAAPPPLDATAGPSDAAAKAGHGPATRDERVRSPGVPAGAGGLRIAQDNAAPAKTSKTGLWAALVVAAVCVVAVPGFYFSRSNDVFQPAPTTEPVQPPPKTAIAFSDSGKEYYDKKDYDRAIAEYSEAIRLDPKLAVAYYGRGLAYYHKNENDRALADFSDAIRLDPENASAFYYRGLVYFRRSDYDRTIADMNASLRLDAAASSYFMRGLSYYYKRDYDRAIPDFSEAIRLNPKWAVAYDSRGDAYVAKGDYERAIADFKQAILLDPSEAEKIKPKLADAERKRGTRK